MSDSSSELLIANDKLSDDSYRSDQNDDKEKSTNQNDSNRGRVKKIGSDARSSSSQNDDKSDHYIRLLRESQQSVSNRDILIGMLQKQLKKMEDLYKKTLDQQQDVRLRYSNVVQELGQIKIICNKLKDENNCLLRENKENSLRYREEKKILQSEVEAWKKEYDQLLKVIENMEKNTHQMKDILGEKCTHQRDESPDKMERLLEQYSNIQEAIVHQNDKLNVFLEKFQSMGGGGCSIVRSLEEIKCINRELAENVNTMVTTRTLVKQEFAKSEAYDKSVATDCECFEIEGDDNENDKMFEENVWLKRNMKEIDNKINKQPESKVNDEAIQTDCDCHDDYQDGGLAESKAHTRGFGIVEDNKEYENLLKEKEALQKKCDKQRHSIENLKSNIKKLEEDLDKRNRELEEACKPDSGNVEECKKYDRLMKAIENVEKNSREVKHMVSKNAAEEEAVVSENIERLTKQCARMQETLIEQNNKLDKFLEKFELIGDGGCTIVKSLERIRCVNKELSDSISSLVKVKETRTIQIPEEDNLEGKKHAKDRECLCSLYVSKAGKVVDCTCGNEVPKKINRATSPPRQFHRDQKEGPDDISCGSLCDCYDYKTYIQPAINENSIGTECGCDEDLGEVKKRSLRQVELDVKYQALLKEKGDLDKEYKIQKVAIAQLQTNVKQMSKDLDKKSKELEAARKAKLESAEKANNLLKELEKDIEDKDERYANALAELETLRNEKQALVEKIDLLDQATQQHTEHDCLCKMETEKLKITARTLVASLQSLAEEIGDKNIRHSEELGNKAEALLELTAEYEKLKKDYDELVEDNKEIDLLRRKNSNLIRELDQRDAMIAEMRVEIVELEEELNIVKEDLLRQSKVASREMDVLMGSCKDLEGKLGEMMANEQDEAESKEEILKMNEMLKIELEETKNGMQKLMAELDDAKTSYDEELDKLKYRNEMLQLKVEQMKEERQRDSEANAEKMRKLAEKPATLDKEILFTGTDDLKANLRKAQEQNRRLQSDLDESKRQLETFKDIGSDLGLVKAENMKLKSTMSTLQKQLREMNDVEEILKKLQLEKEELMVKIQYLENQLSSIRETPQGKSKESGKNVGKLRTLSPIPEEDTGDVLCTCGETKTQLAKQHVTVLYNNKKFVEKSGVGKSTADGNTVSIGVKNRLDRLQLRMADISEMERQVTQLIISVRQQNQRLNLCNFSRVSNEKDLDARIYALKQRREQLMENLTNFQKEIQDIVNSRASTRDEGEIHHHHGQK